MVEDTHGPAVRDGYHDTLEAAALVGAVVSVHTPGEFLSGTVVVVSDTDVLLEAGDGPRFVPLAHINRVASVGRRPLGPSPADRHP